MTDLKMPRLSKIFRVPMSSPARLVMLRPRRRIWPTLKISRLSEILLFPQMPLSPIVFSPTSTLKCSPINRDL